MAAAAAAGSSPMDAAGAVHLSGLADGSLLDAARRDATEVVSGRRLGQPKVSVDPARMGEGLGRLVFQVLAAQSIHEIVGANPLVHNVSVIALASGEQYRTPWHRDGDPPGYRAPACRAQILVALEPDDFFWFVPASHLRSPSPEEWPHLQEDDGPVGPDVSLPGAVNSSLAAGEALAYDWRMIHRGRSGKLRSRLALMLVCSGRETYDRGREVT